MLFQIRNDNTGNILSQYRLTSGYLVCFLRKDDEWIPKSIHNLVAEQYLGYNDENKDELYVIHKDKNKFNNFIDNIGIITNEEYEINKPTSKYFEKLPQGEGFKLLKFKNIVIPPGYFKVNGEIYKQLKNKFLQLSRKRKDRCVYLRLEKLELIFHPESKDLSIELMEEK
jgi:hypothetical protein